MSKKKLGVNSPLKYTLPIYKCMWVYKNGKCKSMRCNAIAGLYNVGEYCNKHIYNASKTSKTSKTTALCEAILKSGKRKGEKCGCKSFVNERCKRHLKK